MKTLIFSERFWSHLCLIHILSLLKKYCQSIDDEMWFIFNINFIIYFENNNENRSTLLLQLFIIVTFLECYIKLKELVMFIKKTED